MSFIFSDGSEEDKAEIAQVRNFFRQYVEEMHFLLISSL
jgi:hypothetical protein